MLLPFPTSSLSPEKCHIMYAIWPCKHIHICFPPLREFGSTEEPWFLVKTYSKHQQKYCISTVLQVQCYCARYDHATDIVLFPVNSSLLQVYILFMPAWTYSENMVDLESLNKYIYTSFFLIWEGHKYGLSWLFSGYCSITTITRHIPCIIPWSSH